MSESDTPTSYVPVSPFRTLSTYRPLATDTVLDPNAGVTVGGQGPLSARSENGPSTMMFPRTSSAASSVAHWWISTV